MAYTRIRPRHSWHDNRCSACGLERRRERDMGRVKHWFYYRNGRLAGARGLPCPGGADSELRVTRIEAEALARVSLGRDPWRGVGVGSREVSQALGRLRRKGFVRKDFSAMGRSITPEGERALAVAFEHALRGWL